MSSSSDAHDVDDVDDSSSESSHPSDECVLFSLLLIFYSLPIEAMTPEKLSQLASAYAPKSGSAGSVGDETEKNAERKRMFMKKECKLSREERKMGCFVNAWNNGFRWKYPYGVRYGLFYFVFVIICLCRQSCLRVVQQTGQASRQCFDGSDFLSAT